MVTEPVPEVATTEAALRKRIHRLFSEDGPSTAPSGVAPHYWVEPTEEQRNQRFLDIDDRIELSDETELGSAQSDEERWLGSPHVGLDGMSPEAMLTGDQVSRQRLCAFVAAIEAAVRQGSFR